MVKHMIAPLSLITLIGTSIAYVMYICKALPVMGTLYSLSIMKQILLPVVGSCVGPIGITLYMIMRLCYVSYSVSMLCVPFAHMGLATYAASLYWAIERRWFRIGLPLLCFMLFVMHPVGMYAPAYASMWIVAMMVGAIAPKNSFWLSLAATYTAHAVGSVIHLYTLNSLTAAQWHALIPIATAERLLFASGMVIAHYLLTRVSAHIKSYSNVVVDMHALGTQEQ